MSCIFIGFLARGGRAALAAALVAAMGVTAAPAAAQAPFVLNEWARPVPRHSVLVQQGYYVWGGSVVEDGGQYHIFYSRWPTSPHSFADGWLFDSEIWHAVASSPGGPFVPTGLVLGKRANDPTFAFWDSQTQHNPHIRRFGNRFYLYYMASVDPGAAAWPAISQRNRIQRNQRIGVIAANSIQDLLTGNFVRPSAPILSPVYSTSAATDRTTNPTDYASNRIVNNQTVVQRPDGKYQLVYKSNWPQYPGYGHGYALADNPDGPFTQMTPPIFSDQPREDENHWYDAVRGKYFLLCKNFAAGGTEQLESTDSVQWTSRGVQFGTVIRWADGVNESVEALERPQLLRDANGEPVMLYMACRRALANGAKVAFNVHIPLRPPIVGAAELTGAADIENDGRLIRAVNFGAVSPITLNGITFTPSGTDPATISANTGLRHAGGAFGAALGAGLVDPAYAGLPEFEDFLDTLVWQTLTPATGATMTFDLDALTVGRTYRLQMFLAESRTGTPARHGPQILSIGSQSLSSFDYGPSSSLVASGATAIRLELTFAATAATMPVTLTQLATGGGGLQIAAFALHDLTPLTVRWRADGIGPGQNLGRDAAGIGDVDGDLRDDVLLVTNTIESTLHSGATGAPLRNHIILDAEVTAGVGDVNGDGVPDYAIGVPKDDFNGFDTGTVHLYSGVDGTLLRRLRGTVFSGQSGLDLAAAGDTDADGFADLLIAGRTLVTVVSGRTFATLHSIPVTMPDPGFPITARGVGDLDRDGFADFAVGESHASRTLPASCTCGRVRVFAGRTGSLLHEWWGTDGGRFGLAVDGVGDVDGDGVDDVLVGEPRHASGSWQANGRIHLMSGATGVSIRTIDGTGNQAQLGSTVTNIGDLDGDGVPDLVAGAFGMSSTSPAPSARVHAFSGASGIGLFVASTSANGDDRLARGLGRVDVDGDGYPEVVASAPNASVSGVGIQAGSALVFDLDTIGIPARSRTFGVACQGSNLHLPHIDLRGRPALGATLQVGLRAAPPGANTALLIGLPQNVPLDGIGMPGCRLLASDLVLVSATANAHGIATTPGFRVPNDPGLLGARAAGQWLCVDPGANLLGLTTSDGLLLLFGD